QGPKTMAALGFATPGYSGQAGVVEGEDLLAFLAAHPATADRFVFKMAQYFVADQPPEGLVARAVDTFRVAGNLGDTLRSMLYDEEFCTAETVRAKTQSGFEFAMTAVRRLESAPTNHRQLRNQMANLGENPHRQPVPTGYPEAGPAWQGPGQVLPRWNFAHRFTHGQFGQLSIAWNTLLAGTPLSGIVDLLLDRIVDGQVPEGTHAALTEHFRGILAQLPANPSNNQLRGPVRDLAGMIFLLPEAQMH
ncbi:MAG: DUF1800 family protein, partial [Planctomycetes bacterium]|nr:DUF1800 family protein [Planctomycetota bacterium]